MGYNEALAGLIGSLNLALPGVEIRLFDAYAILNEVLDDPAAFGFVNTTDACVTPDVPPYACKKPDTYVFWDGTHPTKAMHAVLAHKALAVVAAPWAP
jgi:outer membrane lipase/esterase